MSVEATRYVWTNSPTRGSERLVLLAIADFADNNGVAYPSKRILAERVRVDESTIRRIIRRLEEAGHLTIRRQANRRTNTYVLPIHGPEPPPDGHVADTRPASSDTPADTAVDNSRRMGAKTPCDAPAGEADLHKDGGAAMPPEPPRTINQPPGRATAHRQPTSGGSESINPVADAVLRRLGPGWPLTPADRRQLAPLIVSRVLQGWPIAGLAAFLAANPRGVISPVAVLTTRLDQLPRPKVGQPIRFPRLEWCGECDEPIRMIEIADGTLKHCPRCKPWHYADDP